jgi:hypothetical protein
MGELKARPPGRAARLPERAAAEKSVRALPRKHSILVFAFGAKSGSKKSPSAKPKS